MGFTKIVKLPLFNCKITLTICDNVMNEVLRLYKKNKKIYSEEGCAEGIVFYFDIDNYYLIYEESFISNINCFTHELWHLIDYITNDRGIQDKETKAWLMGYLSETIYKILKSKNINFA